MLHNSKFRIIFATVFHRILDFKAGLAFYLGPFFYFIPFISLPFSNTCYLGFGQETDSFPV